MEIGGEAEGEVGEENTDGGGEDVLGEATGDEAPEEAKRNGGDEAEEEAEDGDGDADGCGHGIKVKLHGHGPLCLRLIGCDGSSIVQQKLRSKFDLNI